MVLEQQQQQSVQPQYYSQQNDEYLQFREELQRLLPMTKTVRDIIETEVRTALKIRKIKNIDPNFLVEAIMSDPEVYENSQLVAELLQKQTAQ